MKSEEYARMFLDIDSVERRVRQFNVDTISGRASVCEHYRRSNMEYYGDEFDEKLYYEITHSYMQLGVEGLRKKLASDSSPSDKSSGQTTRII